MSPADKLRLSPFANCGETTSVLGYRDDSSGTIVASVELPTEMIERTIFANISIGITLSGSGEVTSAASNVVSGSCSSTKTISLSDLVDMLLDHENIRLEETTESELAILLERLQRSIRAVQRVIGTLKSTAREQTGVRQRFLRNLRPPLPFECSASPSRNGSSINGTTSDAALPST